MNIHQFIRMARLARSRPSEQKAKLIVGVILFCLILLGIEKFIGWPDALTVQGLGRRF